MDEACKVGETRQIEKRIYDIQDLCGCANRTATICGQIGDNLLGIEPEGTTINPPISEDFNGSLQELDCSLNNLRQAIERGLANAERIANL